MYMYMYHTIARQLQVITKTERWIEGNVRQCQLPHTSSAWITSIYCELLIILLDHSNYW